MSIPPSKYPEDFEDDVFVDFSKKPVKSLDYHYHKNHCEICLVRAGRLRYIFNNRIYELSPYEMVLLNSTVPHKITFPPKNDKLEYIIINFKTDMLSRISANAVFLMEAFATPRFSVPSDNIPEIDRLFTKLVFESDYPSLFSSELLCQYVYELLVTLYRLARDMATPRRLPTNSIVEAASKYIIQNYSTDISLSDIAEHCHVDRHYLSRLFKNIMGINLILYLNTIRVHEASIMLLQTDKSILDISSLCGFNNIKHFCDVFKKFKGQSAREFRKANKKDTNT